MNFYTIPSVAMPSRLQTLKWLGDSLPSSNAKVNQLLDAEGSLENPAADEQNVASVPDELSSTASSDIAAAASGSDSADDALGAVGGVVASNKSLHDALQQLAPGQVNIPSAHAMHSAMT